MQSPVVETENSEVITCILQVLLLGVAPMVRNDETKSIKAELEVSVESLVKIRSAPTVYNGHSHYFGVPPFQETTIYLYHLAI